MFAIALSAGAAIGQIAGGGLVSADIAGSGWRSIFLVNVPVCVAAVAAAARFLPPDDERTTDDVDLGGVAALSASVLLVVVPLTLGREQGWPPWTWASLAAGAPAFRIFLFTQRRAAGGGRHPLLAIAVMRRPAVVLGLVGLLTATATYYALLFGLAQYFQQGLGRGALASGLILVPWVAAFGLAGQIVRRLPARLGPILPCAGQLLLAAAYAAIGVSLLVGRPGDVVLGALLALGGLGLGTGYTTLMGHLTNSVPAGYAADVSGLGATAPSLGGAIGVAAFGSLYLGLAARPGAAAASHAFAVTSLALAVAAILAAVAAYLATHAPHAGKEAAATTR